MEKVYIVDEICKIGFVPRGKIDDVNFTSENRNPDRSQRLAAAKSVVADAPLASALGQHGLAHGGFSPALSKEDVGVPARAVRRLAVEWGWTSDLERGQERRR